MKEYIKMGFGVAIGITLWGALCEVLDNKVFKKADEPKTEDDKVEESAE